MSWFRANRTFGGRLALFALALQFYLSFGHIHPEDIYGPAHTAVNAPSALPASGHLQTLTDDRHSSRNDDYCEICATISLLSTSFIAAPPQLPLAFVSRAVAHVDRVAAVFVAPRRASFRSRAPPAA